MTIFLWICSLLIPITMVVIGLFWQKHPPKTINNVYGYRTKRSSQSQEAWDYAQRAFGSIWLYVGTATLLLTVPILLWVPVPIENLSTVLVAGQGVAMILPIPFFERHLKHKFGK